MITLLNSLEPVAKIDWAVYTLPAQIDWLHSGKRILEDLDQLRVASGPAEIVPTAIFNIAFYEWGSIGW